MNFTDIWNILGIIAIILLLVFARGKNSVWGGLTLGVIIGLIIAIVFIFKGEIFSWSILKKSAIIGVLAGVAADLLGRLSQKLKK
jgi:hypothetical protein